MGVSASAGCHLTWVAGRALGQSVGQIGQLAAMVTILQGADVHAVPPAKLLKPETLLLGFTVGVQHNAHPQSPCTETHTFTVKGKTTHTHSALLSCSKRLVVMVSVNMFFQFLRQNYKPQN